MRRLHFEYCDAILCWGSNGTAGRLADELRFSDIMTRRKLGKTDLEVSILGFGASPLGNVFGGVDPREGIRAVHRAIDEGINFFDVSPYYGLTLAETRLGEALEGRRQSICR